MPDSTRREVISALADTICSVQCDHPTRVAIEGRSAAGESTLADELAEAVRARGRDVLRASVDDFHRPGHEYRSQRGEWTPRSYYSVLLQRRVRLRRVPRPLAAAPRSRRNPALPSGDLRRVPRRVATGGVAQRLRPDLASHWDVIVWLDIDIETMVQRARRRDVAWVGSAAVVEERYRRHWVPTHELSERLAAPRGRADVVVDNRIIEAPMIVRTGRISASLGVERV